MAFGFGDVVHCLGVPAMVLFQHTGNRIELRDFEIVTDDEHDPVLAVLDGEYVVMNLAEDTSYRRPVGWVSVESDPQPYEKEV